jgi:haloalkane dehalogenase
MKKIAKMMRYIRKKYPTPKIVVGGYGVCSVDVVLPGDVEGDAVYIRDNADYLCRDEGMHFMRKVLNDTPINREITQYLLSNITVLSTALNVQTHVPIILVALGCPNACDFCCTSAMYKHEKIYVAEPEQVYRFMKYHQKLLKRDAVTCFLCDEGFFQNREYVRELGRLIRSDKKTWPITYITSGSIQALSQFGEEELRDCGVKGI